MTAARRYLGHVVALGCVICRRPAQAHHILEGRYSQRKTPDWWCIPLCPEHHAELHAGAETWRGRHGSEIEIAADVQRRVEGAFGIEIPQEYRL